MRPYPLTVLNGGINRLRVKGGAAANQLYDLQNARITNAGSIVPREGTIRAATLTTSNTVGLAAVDGVFNVFSSSYNTGLPANYQCNVLIDPINNSASVTKIWFAKPFMGFLFVVAEFSDGNTFHFWLQNNGDWTANTVYMTDNIVLPDTPNGLAYQAVRDFPPNPLWTAEATITSGQTIEPNDYTGYAYRAVAVEGTAPHTGQVEPVWPTTIGGIIQEFGDFDTSSTDSGTTQASSLTTTASITLGGNITDRYGDSATVANSGTAPSASLGTITTAAQKVTTWAPGTHYAPGAVVQPSTNQGGFIGAIPNGDFENGNDGNWTFTGITDWEFSNTGTYQGNWCIEFPGSGSTSAGGDYARMTNASAVTVGQSVTATGYLNPANTGANLELWLCIDWYDSTDTFLSEVLSAPQEGGGYRQVSVTASAPTGAAYVRIAVRAGSGTGTRNPGYADLISWNLETPAAVSNFLYVAVQPVAGSSGQSEPTWPTVIDTTVQDNTVTWEAIGTSIITWQAVPLMLSGATEPTFPTVLGNTVHDPSTFKDQNGYITSACSMSWVCVNRQISDVNDPQTIPVAIGASHIFAGNTDICSYSAAVNPLDWTTTNNAGYLPTGLNNYGDNPVAMLALYRSNLMVFNAGGYQMWQIDPDPANMALLDAEPVGSIWPRAAQSVANDLLFLTEVGVRNIGTVGATANMQIGNTGQPIDPLVQAQFPPTTGSPVAGDAYYPEVSLLLHMDGSASSQTFLDASSNNNTVNVSGTAAVETTNVKFGTGALSPGTGGLAVPIVANGDMDLSTGNFTIEGWLYSTPGGGAIFDASNNDTGGFYMLWGSTYVEFSLYNGGSSIPLFSGAITQNAWHSFAIVRNGNTFTMFVDGVSQGTISLAGSLLANAGSFLIGTGWAGSFPGYVDEFRITKGVARYTANYTPATSAFNPPTTYNPISLYYPGRGQYWLFFGPQAFVLTINGQGTKSWSRYIFPDIITDWTLSAGVLYMRTAGNLVWQFDQNTLVDDYGGANVVFNGVIQWPYLDMGALGRNKMMVGLDLVGDGDVTIQFGMNQADPTTFNDNSGFSASLNVTAPYTIAAADTVPGEPLPFPINAPSVSLILTFNGNQAWDWEAANLYITDAAGGGSTG